MFEVQNREPSGDEGSRFSRRLIDDPAVGTGEEVFGLAETARVDWRNDTGYEQAPLVPRFVGRWYLSAAAGWSYQLDGIVEAAEPSQLWDTATCAAVSGPEPGRWSKVGAASAVARGPLLKPMTEKASGQQLVAPERIGDRIGHVVDEPGICSAL